MAAAVIAAGISVPVVALADITFTAAAPGDAGPGSRTPAARTTAPADPGASNANAIKPGASGVLIPPPARAHNPKPAPAPAPPPSQGQSCAKPSFVTSNPNGMWNTNGFFVHNNMWNTAEAGPQSLYACAYNNWRVVSTQRNTTSVKTYPNVHRDFDNVPISSFNTITSSFAETSPHVGIYDVAYDIWANGVATDGSTEIMIWNENHKQVPSGSKVATAALGGRTYNIWKTSDSHYIAFVPAAVFTSGTVDILELFKWTMSQGWLPANSTVGQIDFGIEFCSTNGAPATFTVSGFSLTAH